MEYVLTATKTKARAGSYYDRIARLYDLTFKVNGYGRSLDQYFATHPLPVSRGAKILDAGCGTGLLTLALLRAVRFPVSITALDLSQTSVVAARKSLYYSPGRKRDVTFAQGNLLCLPFADESLDLVVTSGALEYVPLADGLTELARVIAPGGHLLHLPVHPSLIGVFLEILFRFKSHPPRDVKDQTERHFRMVHQYRFPRPQAIGWSKTAILAQKV
ncbi:MAG TPA: methyltransferase domain-containing protein [Pyrinomonadaceae bacterium]|jgi:ubiquinone/menaquinone biosynthesis C-methylase UbiE|nr:methyltransferase domain-containing protein [Pyrinomonadaceae bacterium]